MIEARAVRIVGKGDVAALTLGTLGVRDAAPGEVRVRVVAAGLNRADILQRKGFYPAPPGVPADVPGLEYAGTVEQVGEGVRELAVGDRVMGITGGGAMATYVNVHAREVLRVPEGMSLTDAAAIPEVFLTAYDAMFSQGGLGFGQLVLVHAVGSGVGTAALQLGLAAGARVVGSSRTDDKLERCRELGLRDGLCVRDKTFAAEFAELTRGVLADVILDTVGGAYLADNLKVIASQGRLVIVGLLGGAAAELPLGLLLAKRASVIGTVLRSRSLEEKIAVTQLFARTALPWFESGRLKPIVETVLPMTEVREAHTRMEGNATFGKIVLAWD